LVLREYLYYPRQRIRELEAAGVLRRGPRNISSSLGIESNHSWD
jgi:hypothetical protein